MGAVNTVLLYRTKFYDATIYMTQQLEYPTRSVVEPTGVRGSLYEGGA